MIIKGSYYIRKNTSEKDLTAFKDPFFRQGSIIQVMQVNKILSVGAIEIGYKEINYKTKESTIFFCGDVCLMENFTPILDKITVLLFV